MSAPSQGSVAPYAWQPPAPACADQLAPGCPLQQANIDADVSKTAKAQAYGPLITPMDASLIDDSSNPTSGSSLEFQADWLHGDVAPLNAAMTVAETMEFHFGTELPVLDEDMSIKW
jgi:hypothetical protein